MKKKFTLIFILIIFTCTSLYSQIVINEIMYAPADAGNEWFEIYNTGNSDVNLQNWKWKDATATQRTITTQNIIILPDSYLIVCQDSNRFKTQFPGNSGKLVQTLWSALNNTGDNLILIDPANLRKDSVSYQTAWGGNTGGYSLEKRISTGNSNEAENWGTSTSPVFATPGKENSITPKAYDLVLKSFTYLPAFPAEGETLELSFKVKNIGINRADNFSLNIYKDLNQDSIAQNSELINLKLYLLLDQNDSLEYNFSIANADTGLNQFIAMINFPPDNDTLNNVIIKRIYISKQGNGGNGVVINEIMYDPFTNQSEWIEIFNSTSQTINLKGWKYKEASVNVIISMGDLYFDPGDYLILAHDSTLYNSYSYLKFPEENQIVKFITGMSLTNTGETITVTDSLNNIIDAVAYDPGWNNPNFQDTKGISLERINPGFPSNAANNWSSCTKPSGGTPGLQNSIFMTNITSNSKVSVTPNPFSPDGDGFEDFTMIKYKLNAQFSQLRVKIFDIKGRMVKTLANNSVSGNEGVIIFNGLDENNLKLRIGIYILVINAIDERGGTIEIIKAPMVVAAKL